MADEEHLMTLRRGVKAWNHWRAENIDVIPDLSDANLTNLNLSAANLISANLYNATLDGTNLSRARLTGANLFKSSFIGSKLVAADLSYTNLYGANFYEAVLRDAKIIDAKLNGSNLVETDLRKANLTGASLISADLSKANLSGAILKDANLNATTLLKTNLSKVNMSNAILSEANLNQTNLKGTIFNNSTMRGTVFNNLDLGEAQGLSTVRHLGPSSISVDTLYESNGEISDDFLYGCGIPDEFITYLPSLLEAQQTIRFYSCFISYSHKDEEFCERLYSRMRDAHLRVWFAPRYIKGGEKLHEQIDQAIQIHDRLLLILSEDSLNSEWVMTEIRKARKVEIKENRRKLFPIRLLDFDRIKRWECFDADTGKDLAVEVREYFIPDFSKWNNHDAFESAFNKLLKDLRAAEEQ